MYFRAAQKAEIQQRRWQARSGRERRPAPLGRRPGAAIGSPVCLRCYAHIYWGVAQAVPQRRATPNVSMQTALARRAASSIPNVCMLRWKQNAGSDFTGEITTSIGGVGSSCPITDKRSKAKQNLS